MTSRATSYTHSLRRCSDSRRTGTMIDALKALDVVRTGYVVRNTDGTPMRDAQTSHAIYRILDRAALDKVGWHSLRHTFGTHAARFGVSPWQLMEWMGHKRIDETMATCTSRSAIDRSRRSLSKQE